MASTSRCSVVDVPHQDNGVSLTRRAVLGAIATAALAACRPRRSSPAATPSADRAAAEAALEDERALLRTYDAAVAALDAVAAGPLVRARDRHTAHLRALARATRPSPTSTPSAPSPAPADPSTLAATLASSAGTLRSAAITARTGRLAALLASVAAEHAADAALTPEDR
jgi:hypothetical protein